MKKPAAPGWPPEGGCYLRGNESSPVAVVVLLKGQPEVTPPEIDRLISIAVVSGAALAGSLVTENVGFEKVILNMVSNPNIRYLVVCGWEAEGHRAGDAILSLVRNGVDKNRRIVGSKAQNPSLSSLTLEQIERFREQVTVIDVIGEGDPETVGEAVKACCQKEPTKFRNHELSDPGAFPEDPL